MASHTIREYISLLAEKGLLTETNAAGAADTPVTTLSFNSMEAGRGVLFICKGAHFRREYLTDALLKGAAGYVSAEKYDLRDLNPSGANGPLYIIVSDIRKAMAFMANLCYDEAWKKLTIVGVTGTKGKSTTVYYIKYILDVWLESQGKNPAALLSGVENYDGAVREESRLTTAEALELHRHFSNAVRNGAEYLVMEVSSQALKYDRTLGLIFDVACFLNIGEDHVSDAEHSDFEDYFRSKLKIFSQCEKACVNIGAGDFRRVAEAAAKSAEIVTFGTAEAADVYGYDLRSSENGISFRARAESFDEEFAAPMRGVFNAENAIAAIAAACCLNIPADSMRAGLKKAKVSGRMEIYEDGKDRIVIVDYAHNKMSFESLFRSVRIEYPGRKISIVFGCPGKKAMDRRRELGTLAGRYADFVYITEEDAGEESVEDISREIKKYVALQGCDCAVIPDRGEAIRRAVAASGADSVLLVTGKGRETRQKRGVKYVDTPSDVEFVKKYLGI
ncbi:MAG: UDP-N-acetylmuramyl-tripeptide synthetase [Clostridiales Family XIII bacterium]|nr:UDP-N-acetylmuramyl-tripeptide synthetase [Clostridiales Family XIII bacterium]